jgi:hypothetical protein
MRVWRASAVEDPSVPQLSLELGTLKQQGKWNK